MEHLRRSGAARLVTNSSLHELPDMTEELVANPALRRDLGSSGRRYAMQHHDRSMVEGRLLALLHGAAGDHN
jgi:hypothetical protein